MANDSKQVKHFYFSTRQGLVIHGDLALDSALLVIQELKRQGFYFCRAVWVD